MSVTRKNHLDGLALSLLLACCLFWGFQQVLVKATVPEMAPVFQAWLRFAREGLPRLREVLGEQGFQLAHADVGHQAPGGDGNASGASGNGGTAGDGEPSPGDTNVSSAQLIRQRGLLDAYA